ncbi:unnamed protein product [Mesocestoides corti]|uniref:Uncharacterized protein n=1 Tax=Mesocestoides corti TaxID=53468 RepID=A0A0R3UQ46_MESCO|nr:unnamed protein product [Mesocestoides corti]
MIHSLIPNYDYENVEDNKIDRNQGELEMTKFSATPPRQNRLTDTDSISSNAEKQPVVAGQPLFADLGKNYVILNEGPSADRSQFSSATIISPSYLHGKKKEESRLYLRKSPQVPKLNLSGPSAGELMATTIETPVLDVNLVPGVNHFDEPVKLNVIKGTTTYQQLVGHIATRVAMQTNQRPQNVVPGRSLSPVIAEAEKDVDADDHTSIDSGTLLPEGHPAGRIASGENNDIYVCWTADQGLQHNRPAQHLFEINYSPPATKENRIITSIDSFQFTANQVARNLPSNVPPENLKTNGTKTKGTHDSNSDKEEKRVEFEGEGNLFAEGVERELLRRKSTLSTELPAMLDRSKATSGIRHQVYEYDTRDCLLDEMCHRGASLERRSTSKDELGSVNDLGTSSAATASATDTATTTTTTTTVSPKKRHVSRHSSGPDAPRETVRHPLGANALGRDQGTTNAKRIIITVAVKVTALVPVLRTARAVTSLTTTAEQCCESLFSHWPLTSHQAGYPIPSQPYANCGLSSLFYHAPPPPLTYQPAPPPPPPPPPLQPAYMPPPPVVIDAWGHHGCHSRRYSHRHKHRKSSKRLRHDSRCHKSKSSDSTGDSKKRSALNDQQTADRQIQDQTTQTNEVTRTSLLSPKPFTGPHEQVYCQPLNQQSVPAFPPVTTSVVSDMSNLLPPTRPPCFISPSSRVNSLHQPAFVPRGTYSLPRADGPPNNPASIHSFPNEPPNLTETRLAPPSPPTKIDPAPSAMFSGAMTGGNKFASMPDNQSRESDAAKNTATSKLVVCRQFLVPN